MDTSLKIAYSRQKIMKSCCLEALRRLYFLRKEVDEERNENAKWGPYAKTKTQSCFEV